MEPIFSSKSLKKTFSFSEFLFAVKVPSSSSLKAACQIIDLFLAGMTEI